MDKVRESIQRLREESPMAFFGLLIALALFIFNISRRFSTGAKPTETGVPAVATSVTATGPAEIKVETALEVPQFPDLSSLPNVDPEYFTQLAANFREKMPEHLQGEAKKSFFKPYYTKKETVVMVEGKPEVKIYTPMAFKYQGFFILNDERKAILKGENNQLVYASAGEILAGTPYRIEEIDYRQVKVYDIENKKLFSVGFDGKTVMASEEETENPAPPENPKNSG